MRIVQRHIGLIVLICFIGLTGLIGCNRVKPQGAANRQAADSTAQALMEMNFLMALEADELLVDSVQASGLPYVLDQHSFWYLRLDSHEGREVQDGMRVAYSATIRDLQSGALLEERSEEVEVGKRQTLRAIDMCFTEMREGETFRLLVPFYNAYGRDGNDYVAPLTNVVIVLKVNNITSI